MKMKNTVNTLIILTALSPVGYLLITWRSIRETFILKFEFSNSSSIFLACSTVGSYEPCSFNCNFVSV